MRIGALVQARMSSRRLPGKVLRPVHGRPLLGYLLDRLRCVRHLDLVAVTTSRRADDDAIVRFCQREEIPCYRGDLADVAGRYLGAMQELGLHAAVRVTGDSPLLDPRLVHHGLRLFREHRPDLVSNVFHRTFPRGQSVEVVARNALERAHPLMNDPEDREHVTRYFYRHPGDFQIVEFRAPVECGALQLSVDQPEDLTRFAEILQRMERLPESYGWEEIVQIATAGSAAPPA